jgi:hypothetical protein
LLIATEDFEVSIFLTEMSTRHSLLTKQKHFKDPGKKRIQSNSNMLTGDTSDNAIEVEDVPMIRREDSEDDAVNMQDLPDAEDVSDADSLFVAEDEPRRSKRPRAVTASNIKSSSESPSGAEPAQKRRKDTNLGPDEPSDDKKKMTMKTTYDGFSIYGRVLCLVVKRKDGKGKGPAKNGGQVMMEDWITSTQMPQEMED